MCYGIHGLGHSYSISSSPPGMQHSRILRRRPNSNQRWISHTGISGTCSNLQILITTDQIASFEKIAPLHGSYLTVSFSLAPVYITQAVRSAALLQLLYAVELTPTISGFCKGVVFRDLLEVRWEWTVLL